MPLGGGAPSPPTVGTRRPSKVAPGQIPNLPPAPPPTTRAKPEGIVRPPTEPPPPVEVRGRWRQVEGGSGPDFLPGGYLNSVWVFRYNGLLEVRRTFGKDESFQQTWRVGYEWDKDKNTLTVGSDAKRRPPPESLKGFTLGDADVTVQAASQPLPMALPCVRREKGRLRIGDKVYEPVPEQPAPSAAGK